MGAASIIKPPQGTGDEGVHPPPHPGQGARRGQNHSHPDSWPQNRTWPLPAGRGAWPVGAPLSRHPAPDLWRAGAVLSTDGAPGAEQTPSVSSARFSEPALCPSPQGCPSCPSELTHSPQPGATSRRRQPGPAAHPSALTDGACTAPQEPPMGQEGRLPCPHFLDVETEAWAAAPGSGLTPRSLASQNRAHPPATH